MKEASHFGWRTEKRLRIGREAILGAIERRPFADALQDIGQGFARGVMKERTPRGDEREAGFIRDALGPTFADPFVGQEKAARGNECTVTEDFSKDAGHPRGSVERKQIAAHLFFWRHDEDRKDAG